MFFHPKNLKSENNNPWFNILLHTQSIVCATVDSQCLEYVLGTYKFVEYFKNHFKTIFSSVTCEYFLWAVKFKSRLLTMVGNRRKLGENGCHFLLGFLLYIPKGKIISECPYEKIVCPKIATKKFPRFLP